MKLDVRYFAQNDNDIWDHAPGEVQCCPTSNAMLAAHVRKDLFNTAMNSGLYPEFECFYKEEFEKCGYDSGDRGNHDAHTVCLQKRFKIDTRWTTQGTFEEIKKALDNNFPVVVAVDYKQAGHVKLIVGYDDQGFWIHDPYGVRAGSSNFYSIVNPGWGETYGKYDYMSWSLCDQIMFDRNGHAWVRLPVEKI